MEKVKAFWDSLDQNIVVNKREVFLSALVCILGGMVVGTLLSPKINVTVGNNNSYGAGEDSEIPDEDAEESDEE